MKRYFILILVFLNLSSSEDLSDDADDSGYLKGVENLVEIENTVLLTSSTSEDLSDDADDGGYLKGEENVFEIENTELNNICEGFLCKDNNCISSNLTCNGIPDCPDRSDEDSCPGCPENWLNCGNGKCVASMFVCDGQDDCGNMNDEIDCDKSPLPEKVSPCQGNDFHCSNGRCILASWKCDDRDDCGDNSDELDCPLPEICKQDKYQCDDGQCISKLWRCDGESDCSNGSDENDCNNTSCVPEIEIRCGNGQCLPIHWACDGTNDCNDGADEKMCSVKKICDLTEFKCDDGLCINKTFVCNQKQDCTDGSDEKNCSRTCKEGFYQCNDGATCIYSHELCDGHEDCPDGDDEVNCAARCNPEEYYFCTNNSRCISKRWICDGDNDCGDAADEMPEICNRHITHAKFLECKEFFCNVSAECVSWSKVCDGQNDCKDLSDESGMCSKACADDHGACSQVCQKTPLGSKCSCYKGYTLSPDGFTCEDVNECDFPGSCSQFCNNTNGSFECYCAEGYVLDNEQKCKADGGPVTLLYVLPDEIKGIDLSSRWKRVYVNETLGDIRGFDYDASLGVLFWSDWRRSTINSYTLSNNTREVLRTCKNRPERIRWDWIQENFYFTADGDILVCSKNGEFCSTVIPAAATIIFGFDISPIKGFMFWSVWAAKPLHNKGIIERTDLDGSNRKVIIDEGLTWPSAVTVDHVMEMIYWTDAKLNVMESSDFHGLKRRVVVSNDMYHPFSMAVFEDSVFWSDWGTDSIMRCDKFSGKNCTYFHKGHVKSEVLQIVHKGYQPKGENRCLNHECPQLCLPTRTSFVCKCDDDYDLVNGTCETKTETKPEDWLDKEAEFFIEHTLNI